MHTSPSILVVDDEHLTRDMLCRYFEQEGFATDQARDGEEMLKRLEERDYDVLLLDILMPGPDGLSLAPKVRERYPGMGLVLVTSKDSDLDRILGLEVGADDYITKPFNLREILARVRALLRRLTPPAPVDAEAAPLMLNHWRFDPAAGGLIDGGGEARLLPKGELVILKELARRPGLVCPREQLLGVLERAQGQASSRSLDVQISRLRGRIDDETREIIVTVRGVGYVLQVGSPGGG
jgi:DNA-binding response OmpR family regulator